MIVGGGHNGLVAAAYLARAGLSTLVCERREIVGGAAVSEHPFGPDYTVTSLSYVVSLLPAGPGPRLATGAARLPRLPAGPVLRAARRRPLPAAAARPGRSATPRSPSSPRATPPPIRRTRRTWTGIGAILGPMLSEIPPRLGSRRPQDLLRQGLLLRHLRNVDTRAAVDITRLLSSSIADLLDGYFESDALRGLLSVSGVIGTWAGPAIGRQRLRDAASSPRRRGRPGRRLGLPARRHGRRHGGAGRSRQVVRRRDPHRRQGRRHHHQRRPRDRRHAGRRRGDQRGHGDHHGASGDLVPRPARPVGAAGRLRRRHPRLAVAQRHREDQPGGRPAAGLRQSPGLRPAGARRHDRAGREPG